MSDPDDATGRLRAAGFDLSGLDAEQLELLAALTEDELTVLLEIRERLGDVDAEVEAHLPIGGLLF